MSGPEESIFDNSNKTISATIISIIFISIIFIIIIIALIFFKPSDDVVEDKFIICTDISTKANFKLDQGKFKFVIRYSSIFIKKEDSTTIFNIPEGMKCDVIVQKRKDISK